jgi:hypothetical protein
MNRSFGGAFGAALAALAVVALTSLPARADVGSDRRTVSVITFGPSLELDLDASLRFGGEVALSQYTGSSGLGVALGFVQGRIYLEAQPAVVLGSRLSKHNLVMGFNPGIVVDVTDYQPRYGGQLTIWANYARSAGRLWALPLFPFVRVQGVAFMGFAITGGVMLKLPIPVS